MESWSIFCFGKPLQYSPFVDRFDFGWSLLRLRYRCFTYCDGMFCGTWMLLPIQSTDVYDHEFDKVHCTWQDMPGSANPPDDDRCWCSVQSMANVVQRSWGVRSSYRHTAGSYGYTFYFLYCLFFVSCLYFDCFWKDFCKTPMTYHKKKVRISDCAVKKIGLCQETISVSLRLLKSNGKL